MSRDDFGWFIFALLLISTVTFLIGFVAFMGLGNNAIPESLVMRRLPTGCLYRYAYVGDSGKSDLPPDVYFVLTTYGEDTAHSEPGSCVEDPSQLVLEDVVWNKDACSNCGPFYHNDYFERFSLTYTSDGIVWHGTALVHRTSLINGAYGSSPFAGEDLNFVSWFPGGKLFKE